MNKVWVEVINGKAVRIFKNHKFAQNFLGLAGGIILIAKRSEAVSEIRQQIWDRQSGVCARCPNIITNNFHMHERVSRGRRGEISLDNSEGLCADCHIGPRGAHSNRLSKFTKGTERITDINKDTYK